MALQYSIVHADRSESTEGAANACKSKPLLTPRIVADLVKIVDFATVMAPGVLALEMFHQGGTSSVDVRRHIVAMLLGAVLFVFSFQWIGGYQFTRLSQIEWQLRRVIATWLIIASFLLTLAVFGSIESLEPQAFILRWASTTLGFLVIERAFLHQQIGRLRRQGKFTQKLAIFGAGPPGEQLVAAVQAAKDQDLAVLGIFDDRSTRISPVVGGHPIAGTSSDLVAFVRRTEVDQVIVALPSGAERRAKEIFDKLKSLPVDLRLSNGRPELSIRGMSFTDKAPVFEIWNRPIQHWNAIAKTVSDKIFASALLVLLAIPMALITILIKIESRGPVFFVQNRHGYNNRVIRVLKFRTMYVSMSDPSGAQRTIRNDPRVTRIGRFLRRSSLDEVPQLINVMRGELSVVGPRPHPIAMRVADRLFHEAVAEYFGRHRVKPGITGWAQVNGCRGEVDTAEVARQRIKYDIEYIENWSFWLDVRILLATIVTVFRKEKAY